MDKRFWIAGVAASVLSFLAGFVVHGALLSQDYMQLKALFRTNEEAVANFPVMLLAHALRGFAIAWIYAKGVSAGSWAGQGIRFGIALVFLIIVPVYLIYYAVQPWPAATVAKQIVFDGIGVLITALAVAFIYRPMSRQIA